MSKMSSLWFRIAPVFLLFFVSFSLLIASPSSVYAGEAPAPTPPAEGATEGEVSDESCESAGGDFSFGLCPLLRLSNDGIQLMDRKIRSSLEVNPKYFEAIPATNSNGDPNPRAGQKPIQQIWATFRNIAAIMLLPILLVLVIGTALGFSVVDAYTVKRAMPRLFIAVIFMALSYDICLIMIDVTTALGRGVGGIVAAPFGGANNLTLPAIFMPPGLPDGGDGGGGAGGFFKNILTDGASIATAPVRALVPGADTAFAVAGGLLAAMSLSAASVVSIAILGSFFFVGLVLMIIIFTILAVRELVIVFLVVMSPLAILSWIFPGNDKLWKVWWDTFTKLLLVYPVIMGLIMLGRGFASLINEVGNTIDPGSIEMVFFVISKLAVYIGPFFLIMFVLKILTGAFGTFTGMMNDKRRGFFDKQRNYRAGKRKELVEASKAGTRYNKMPFIGKSAPMRKASRAISYGRNARAATQDLGANPLAWKRRMGQNLRGEMGTQEHDMASELAEKNRDFAAISGDDAKLYAARHRNRGDIERALEEFDGDRFAGEANRASREEAIQQIMRSQTGSSNETYQKARVRAMAKTGTGYINQETGEFEADRMLQDINDAYGNDRNGAGRALAEMKGSLANSGQIAGMAGFGTWIGALEQMHYARPEDRGAVAAAAHDRIMADAANSVTPGQAMYGKPSSARALAASHRNRIETIVEETNAAETDMTTARQNAANTQAGYASGTHTMAQVQAANQAAAQATDRFRQANEALDAATAAAAGLLDAMNHSASPANASAFANELMAVKMNVRSNNQPPQTVYGVPGGAIGPPTPSTHVGPQGPPEPVSVRDLIDERMNNEAYRNRRRDMGARSLADAEAARNASNRPGGGAPGGPGTGMPTYGP